MQRLHLAEFGDQPWLSGRLRELYTECLSFVIRSCGFYRKTHVHLAQWAAKTGAEVVLDLGSGSGAPIDIILREAASRNRTLPKFVLSDRFPVCSAYSKLQELHGSDKVDYISHPLPAAAAGTTGIKHRCICSAFHHFSPEEASLLLEDAVQSGGSLLIIEPFDRTVKDILLTLCFGLPLGMLSPFFSGRLTPSGLLLCTIIPVVPLMVQIDGIISALRTYRPEEIRKLLPEISDLEVQSGPIDHRSPHSSYYFWVMRQVRRPGRRQEAGNS